MTSWDRSWDSIEILMHHILALLTAVPLLGSTQLLTPVWVETGPNHQVLARVVIQDGSECPLIAIDNAAPMSMHMRKPVPKHFQPACEFHIPAGTKRAAVGLQKLVLPADNPSKIIVIGDT